MKEKCWRFNIILEGLGETPAEAWRTAVEGIYPGGLNYLDEDNPPEPEQCERYEAGDIAN